MNRIRRDHVITGKTETPWLDLLLGVWAVLGALSFIAYVVTVNAGMQVAMELNLVARYVYVTVVAVCIVGLALRFARSLKGKIKE